MIVVQVEPEQLVERAEEPLWDLEDVVETDKEGVQSGGQVGVLNRLQLGDLVSEKRDKEQVVKWTAVDWSILRNFSVLRNCEIAGANLRETAKLTKP